MADPTETDVRTEGLSPAPKPRRRQPLFIGLVALPVVAAAGAGAIWWMHRADDLSVGSKHHVTIHVRKVGPGDCLNSISGVTIRGRYWHSDDHAPDPWGSVACTGRSR